MLQRFRGSKIIFSQGEKFVQSPKSPRDLRTPQNPADEEIRAGCFGKAQMKIDGVVSSSNHMVFRTKHCFKIGASLSSHVHFYTITHHLIPAQCWQPEILKHPGLFHQWTHTRSLSLFLRTLMFLDLSTVPGEQKNMQSAERGGFCCPLLSWIWKHQ